MKRYAIALLSGGLDSSVALALAREEYNITLALTFDYGQRASTREIEAAKKLCLSLCIQHKVIELPWLASVTQTSLVNAGSEIPSADERSLDEAKLAEERASRVWVPNRNGLFANIAACYADSIGAQAIVMGLNAEEGIAFSDNTPDFMRALNGCFEFSTKARPVLVSPTAEMTKVEIAEQACRMGIKGFWSCYRGGEKMCGSCESCVRTIRAFKQIGKLDEISNL